MHIHSFIFNHISVNTYVLISDDNSCALIDPGCSTQDEESYLTKFLKEKQIDLKYILLTHAHADHIQGCEYLKATFPKAVLAAHPDCSKDYSMANSYSTIFGFKEHNYPPFELLLNDGDELHFGSDTLEVIYTPGHAKGSVCYYSKSPEILFSGDTLFYRSVGRCDFPGGSQTELIKSLKEKIATLPPQTKVYCGHGETTDIGTEIKYNIYFQI